MCMNQMTRLKTTARDRLLPLLLAALIGAAAFLILYGTIPLNAANDGWLCAQYDEPDNLRHYAGWLAYRLSPWRFPIGMAEKLAIGSGTIISYSDSIPWVAVFFKMLRRFLPQTFQYFGPYGLLCFMLQGIASYLLIEHFTKNRLYSLIGSVLFCFSPIMIERMFRHTALGSHWLILFSILIYFRHRRQGRWANWLLLLLLEVLAIGIHPYFLPMVCCFSLLCLIEDLRRKNLRAIPAFFGVQAGTLFAGWILGAIGGVPKNDRPLSYGVYSLNLNALINPKSLGGYTWSRVLPQRGQILGNIDGFNYLGLGVLLALLLLAAGWAVTRGWQRRAGWHGFLERNFWLLLASVGLTLYAVTNVVTLDGRILLECPLPKVVLKLCDIFRGSSRMFYPVYYLIFLSVLLLIWRQRGRFAKAGTLTVCALCLMLCAVQLWDMSGMIAEKHTGMAAQNELGRSDPLFSEPELIEATQYADRLIVTGPGISDDLMIKYAVWALKNNLDVHFGISMIAKEDTYYLARREEILNLIQDTHHLHRTIIVTADPDEYNKYITCIHANAWLYCSTNYIIYQKDNFGM